MKTSGSSAWVVMLGSIALVAASSLVWAEATPPRTATLVEKVGAAVDADTPRLIAIFKDLHQHPEIAFTETRTAAIVATDLKARGFKVTESIGKTGVVGLLENGPGPTVWFRADMDANSVREATGLPYASTTQQRLADGSDIDVMHACGHDAHITWLLGFAINMKEKQINLRLNF